MQKNPDNFVPERYFLDEDDIKWEDGKEVLTKGYKYTKSFNYLMIEAVKRYRAQLSEENTNMTQKYGKVVIEAIYSVGIIPLFKIIDLAHVVEEENKEPELDYKNIKFIADKKVVPREYFRPVEPPLEKMVVEAKKIIR